MKYARLALLVAVSLATLAALLLGGCGHKKEFRVAVFPPDDAAAAALRYESLRTQLQKALGMPVKIIYSSDYSGVIEALRTKKVELGEFGPLSYVLAKREADAEPCAAPVGKTGDGVYHAVFLVKSDSPYHSLKDLKGKRIALVDPASTSGSLMPHYYVRQETGMDLEDYFGKPNVTYAGTHPAAILALSQGTVDVCGVEWKLDQMMMDKGQIPQGSVRIIWTSPDLPPSPWCYRNDLNPALKEKIKQCLLGMHDVQYDKYARVDHFREVATSEYDLVEKLVDELKVKRDQILHK